MPHIPPSLLELFEAVERELAATLSARHTLVLCEGDPVLLRQAARAEQRLRRTAALLEEALDPTKSGAIH